MNQQNQQTQAEPVEPKWFVAGVHKEGNRRWRPVVDVWGAGSFAQAVKPEQTMHAAAAVASQMLRDAEAALKAAVETEDDRRYREHIADVTDNGRMALISAADEILSVYGPGSEVPEPKPGQRIARVYWRGDSRGWREQMPWEEAADLLVASGRWQLAPNQNGYSTRLLPTSRTAYPFNSARRALEAAGWTCEYRYQEHNGRDYWAIRPPGADPTNPNTAMFMDADGPGVKITG